MVRYASMLLILVTVSLFAETIHYKYTGVISDTAGQPIENALVSITIFDTMVTTDNNGYYVFEGDIATALKIPTKEHVTSQSRLADGTLYLQLPTRSVVEIAAYHINGSLIKKISKTKCPAGLQMFNLFSSKLSEALYIVSLNVNNNKYTFSYAPGLMVTLDKTTTHFLKQSTVSTIASTVPQLRVSAAGFLSRDTIPSDYTGTYDWILAEMEQQETGTAGVVDGSTDRLRYWGNEQYFWGDPGTGKEIPLVKIITAVSSDAVDVALIFNPGFVDNTYGTGVVGWSKHTFVSLVKSDHIQLSVRNGDSDVVFLGKIDMISVSAAAPSGYASLGPYGGDGTITEGDPAYILSFGTSMDDNLNYYGYHLYNNSPTTTSTYEQNPDYPNWEYYAIYRISFDPALFGESGYGDVQMTSVHASPAKTPQETVIVTEGEPPVDNDDPFTYTHFGEPPVDTTEKHEIPPTDTTGDGEEPPTDTVYTGGEEPPTDTTGTDGEQPPADTTDSDDQTPTDSTEVPGDEDTAPQDSSETGGEEEPPQDVLE